MSLNVLITGGAGYLGSVLTPTLLEQGHKVTVLDNFMYNEHSLAGVCYRKELQIVRGDARDKDLLSKLIKDKDYVVPLAALVGAPLCQRDPIGAETINRDAVKLLTEVMSKDQRIVIPITNSGYGVGDKGKFCTEESPLRPISVYGRTKVEAEQIALGWGSAVSLRLATVFGMSPRLRTDLLVNDFTQRAVRDRFVVVFEGHFKRNYIHIRDVAKAMIHAMSNFDKMKGQAYNVGLSDANLSKLELCAEIKKQIPEFAVVEAEVGEDPDKRDYIVSNEKVEKTGYKPDYSLGDGITELIKGYRMLKNAPYGNV